jgi:preprotein translocase subunit SecA
MEGVVLLSILKMFDSSERFLKKNKRTLQHILRLEEEISKLSDIDLKNKTIEFKERLKNGETEDDILPEVFAVCREAGWRTLKMKHFPVQLLGGIALHQGNIAEMKTGEGKTLVVTLPAYLNALTGKGVHIVTVNEYLAKRDKEQMGQIFEFLGLTVGLIYNQQPTDEKKRAYQCDITYGTNSEYGFDYLRDHMVTSPAQKVQRGLNYTIIDEVDSVLIDEARTPLIITSPKSKSPELYIKANEFIKTLSKEDVNYFEKDKAVSLTESGIEKAEKFFGIENLADLQNITINHHINVALKAHYITKRDIDYIIKNGKVILIDQFTGRLAFGKQYSNGLHQGIEAKEGLDIHPENATDATITYQNYFKMYNKASGMTGTALTELSEFRQIYGLDVIVIPTNKPVIRKDLPDLVYKTQMGKYHAIIKAIKERYENGQPVLVGTTSVEKSELLSNMLNKESIPHQVLNAKFHEIEAYIVAQAGRYKMVTIATNMAGRGTDILLGGNAEYLAEEEFVKKHGFKPSHIDEHLELEEDAKISMISDFESLKDHFKYITEKEKELVLKAGGLCVIGTERHEARRIDNQLRGRSGRQGDPGESIFFLSLEDDLLRLFGGDKVQALAETLKLGDDTPISSGFLSNLVENAQKKLEGMNFGIRKNVFDFDSIVSVQRKHIYEDRDKVLDMNADELQEVVNTMASSIINQMVDGVCSVDLVPDDWDLDSLMKEYEKLFGINVLNEVKEANGVDEIKNVLLTAASNRLGELTKSFTDKEDLCRFFRTIMLNSVDVLWKNHIENIEELKQGIGLRSYGQKDPKMAFHFESYEMYKQMIEQIAYDTLLNIYHAQIIEHSEPVEEVAG